jgi:Family of unknown function (DUF6516)
LTKVSAVDKCHEPDRSIDDLLFLDGNVYEVGGGFWVECHVRRVPVSPERPNGVDYGLCLINPEGERMVCYDNAHAISTGRVPSRKLIVPHDHRHRHRRGAVEPYAYVNAGQLVTDFWVDVEQVLKEEGIP